MSVEPMKEGLANVELEAILGSAMDAIVVVDDAQRILLFNHAAERLFACSRAEALGAPLLRFIPSRFRRSQEEAMRRFAREEGTSGSIRAVREVAALRADGSEIPVEASISQVRVGGRHLFAVILRDVSDQRRAEQSLRLLASLVESSDDAIIGWALDGEVLSWNRGAERMYGIPAAQVIGSPITRIVPPEKLRELEEIQECLRRGESIHRLRTTRLDRAGRQLDVSLTLSPTRDHRGRVDGVSSIGRDITAELDAEAALREAERKMRAAQELASLGTLTAGLAHEVGTPMNVILGHAQLLEAEAADRGVRETAHIIAEQVRRVTGIIETLLNIARPRRRQPVAVDLAGILDGAVDFLSEKLRRRRIEVERDQEPLPPVNGDPERLQQLFLNLFLNAVDAMPGGGFIRLEARPGGDDRVEVRIRDSGAGISEEALPQIFEPFFTTKARGAGTGLGLAVCKGIVLDHAGEIDVRSELGKGSEFLIQLPAARSFSQGAGT